MSSTKVIRAILLLVALAGGWWSMWAGVREWQGRPLATTAARIMVDETLSLEALAPVLAYLDRTEPSRDCQSPNGRDAAIIRSYAVEEAYSSDTNPEREALLEKARREVRRFLACRPHEGFFWYALFRLEMIGGDVSAALPFLEMSYALAPHEGWIMRRRNFHAVMLYDLLTPELQARAGTEFTLLVRDLLDDAVAIITSADAPVQDELLAGVASLPVPIRRALAARLDALDMAIDVPGVDYGETLPWRRKNRPSPQEASQ